MAQHHEGQGNQGNQGNKGQNVGDQARHLAEQARQAAGNVGERARDIASTAAERAREVGSTAAQQASQLGQQARERAEQGVGAVASGMRNVASQLRHNVPHEGMMGTAASGLADTLERGGSYLEEEGISGMVNDMGTLIRRNPIPAVLVGVGLGFMLAHLLRSER